MDGLNAAEILEFVPDKFSPGDVEALRNGKIWYLSFRRCPHSRPKRDWTTAHVPKDKSMEASKDEGPSCRPGLPCNLDGGSNQLLARLPLVT